MRWGRAIRTLLVFALLGAVTTVLSSWAIHAVHGWPLLSGLYPLKEWQRADSRDGLQSQADARPSDERWTVLRRLPSGHAWAASAEPQYMVLGWQQGVGWSGRYVEIGTRRDPDERFNMGQEKLLLLDSGWPLPAFSVGSYTAFFVAPDATQQRSHTPALSLHGGAQVLPWIDRRHQPASAAPLNSNPLDRFALPLLPLWPGFAINTAFYALLLFGALRTPGVVRRTLRRRRGRCVGCGYSRDGLDAGAACPECGAGVDARVATAPAAAT